MKPHCETRELIRLCNVLGSKQGTRNDAENSLVASTSTMALGLPRLPNGYWIWRSRGHRRSIRYVVYASPALTPTRLHGVTHHSNILISDSCLISFPILYTLLSLRSFSFTIPFLFASIYSHVFLISTPFSHLNFSVFLHNCFSRPVHTTYFSPFHDSTLLYLSTPYSHFLSVETLYFVFPIPL
jgi:hypothetical protein